MEMKGSYRIAAPREKVWAALNDPEVLRECIPGCESLQKVSDVEFEATVSQKVGPVSARFTGKVTLSDIKAPESYRISGEGSGGVAGFARGGANVRLLEVDGGTQLEYEADATVGGKLAQLGSRLIDASAKKVADQFFGRFAEKLGAPAEAAASPLAAPAAAAATEAPAPEGGVDRIEETIEDAEARLEVAAGRGFLGGPVAWGFIALAVIVIVILILSG